MGHKKVTSWSQVQHKYIIRVSHVSNNVTNGYCDSKVANTDWFPLFLSWSELSDKPPTSVISVSSGFCFSNVTVSRKYAKVKNFFNFRYYSKTISLVQKPQILVSFKIINFKTEEKQNPRRYFAKNIYFGCFLYNTSKYKKNLKSKAR